MGREGGGNGEGMGREWGGQFTSNLGPGWTGSHHTKGGIPSKQEGFEEREELARGMAKGNQQGE